VVDGDPHRLAVRLPGDFALPPDGLNIRLGDTPQAQEARLHDHKRFAAQAFARANRSTARARRARRRASASSRPAKLARHVHALEMLGSTRPMRRLGITTYKVGMVWPLEPSVPANGRRPRARSSSSRRSALIETQLKEALRRRRPPPRDRLEGRARRDWLFSVKLAPLARPSSPEALGERARRGRDRGEASPPAPHASLTEAARAADNAARDRRAQAVWFCAGCPHNSSTVVPEGSRAYAGIGCHYMVQWMDRETEGFTHMGGEGANWIGEAPFSTRPHVFQNLGDGTYNHSGLLAIRAAVARASTSPTRSSTTTRSP
jgi:indolepyruvate ferredoxin oxidoreductase